MRFAPSAKLAAVALTAALALTACGGSDNSSTSNSSGGAVDGTGKKLNILTGVNNQYPEQQKEWFKDIAAKFKAKTGADVEFETFASANDELTRIQTSVVSGQGPDVYSLGTTFTPTAYATKAFVTLSEDDWKKVGGKDRFNPAALGISGPDSEHQAGIPFVSRPFVMAYNKDLLAAAGIEKPATTWDELAEQAKKMTNAGTGTYGLATGYKDNFDPWKFIWAMSVQAGNPLVDGDKLKMDDPTVKKAYETYFGWLTKDKVVDPAAIGWSNSNAVAAFASGKAGYLMMTTSSSIPTLDKSAIAGKYAYSIMPTTAPGESSPKGDGDKAASILSGDNVVVADYSQQKDLAFAYIELITSKEEQLNYQKIFGELPANAEALASLTDPKLQPIADAASKSKATPFTGAWGDIQLGLLNVTVQSIPDLAKGSVDNGALETRLKDAQSKGQASLDRAAKS
ncbi:sugar ABC transporter substrate-binding protein [Arthrobacter sp. StoSoilB3]|uniref:ABC transporter substrate-binding protein n=1 Tax=Paenarthrobacter TaxID=1742992 RepID=UPI0006F589EE|nr:extracellular solute-binding protein [Paenarthrobacter nicotinovorans]KQR02645.1 ABC transporter substrate-binding protein [Arthrobacter sp. Leaf145]BCW09207.1 sugar ABC transporter substrate-binding protein [Arthrobacter sp. NtRootA2]BCW13287.1 sugar ABC transporter substrate-binding protein [Arthrobacter sp. NtRootA4]BCW21623.1 sugar ABC transporter substrate-binding protein [Arthrobacter sp. NtRootC7]BCW25890.1 sugar ABC transporter substrate-binding protein [Arthrobacter sp. NtRootC45]